MKQALLVSVLALGMVGCGGPTLPVVIPPPASSDDFGRGAVLALDLDGFPVQVDFLGAGDAPLPKSVDLSANLPTVGNQRGYGTCVAWSTGYYLKTYLNARDQNIGTSALNSSNTFSPSYLFRAIPDSQKGADCDGTSIDKALEAMKTGGITTLSTTPSFTNTKGQPGECDNSRLSSSEKSAAASTKIDRYFRINPITPMSIKSELAAGRPVTVGLSVGKSFQNYKGGVISSDTSEGGHAMLLVGYDDSKGANGAFRGVNSWGSNWGESGFYWIDYNYLVKSVKDRAGNAFVAYNPRTPNTPPPSSQSKANLGLYTPDIAYSYNSSGLELTWDLISDGKQNILNSAKYYVFFVYVNDFDASDFVLDNTLEFGRTDTTPNKFNYVGNDTYAMNVALPSGSTLAEKVFGSADSNIVSSLGVPDRNFGLYRLWVIVSRNLDEADYDDNYLYSDNPLRVVNGEFRSKAVGSSSFKMAPLHAATDSNYRYEDLVPLFDRIKAQARANLHAQSAGQEIQHRRSSILKSSIPR